MTTDASPDGPVTPRTGQAPVATDPAAALSDGAQSLTPETLEAEMPVLERIAAAVGREL